MENLCKFSKSKLVAGTVQTHFGEYTIKVCKTGVHDIFLSKGNAKNPDENSDPKVSISQGKEKHSFLDQCKDWLENYFQKNSKHVTEPPVCYEGLDATVFERKAWAALQTTKTGETLSYGQLAAMVDNPKAARAVGTAMKKNPIPILVPCHRVLRSDGSIGNYSGGGSKNKEWLLSHEQAKKMEVD